MRRTPVVVLCLTALAGALAGCSSGAGATPTTNRSPSAAASTTATSAVPTVTHPLDSSKFQSAPCSALTNAQLQDLGVPAANGTAETDTVGPSCSWTAGGDSGIGNSAGVTWDTSDANGMDSVYERKSVFTYWTTTSVDGYPAVIGDVMDDRAKGYCAINVGVSDKMMFIARYSGTVQPQMSQSCQLAQQVADDVIKNLGG